MAPTYSSTLYASKEFKQEVQKQLESWFPGPGIIEVVKRPKSLGSIYPTNGTIYNAIQGVPINEVGKEASRNYNIKVAIKEFMDSALYYQSRDFAAMTGLDDSWKIAYTRSGFLDKDVGAAIFPLIEDYVGFAKNKDFSKWIQAFADSYKVSTKAAALYLMLHEFGHLYGAEGDITGEWVNEETINMLMKGGEVDGKKWPGLIALVQGAKHGSELDKSLEAILYSEIAKIASKRKGQVEVNYAGRYLRILKSRYYNAALAEGIETPQGVRDYIDRRLMQALADGELTGEDAARYLEECYGESAAEYSGERAAEQKSEKKDAKKGKDKDKKGKKGKDSSSGKNSEGGSECKSEGSDSASSDGGTNEGSSEGGEGGSGDGGSSGSSGSSGSAN